MVKTSCITALLTLALAANVAFAKSSKYSRPSSSDTSSDTAAPPAGAAAPSGKDSAAAPGAPGAPATAAAPGAGGEKKVDLSELESRYWTAKDTEFNVVQNRLYTKAKRFSLTPMVGTDLSGAYTNDYNFGLAINYYFSERQGIELQGWKSVSNKADFVTTFEQAKGASYDFNYMSGYVGVNYNWVPIYAKLSLLEKKIFYFDMSINPGLGVTLLTSNAFAQPTVPANPQSQVVPTLAIDIAQQVFLNEHWAVKLDLDSHLYQESIKASGTSTPGVALRNKFTYMGVFMLGLTFFQ